MKDAGLYALEVIKTRLGIEDSWSVVQDRGFGWIASNLIQHIYASPPFERSGIEVSQIVIQTGVVESLSSNRRAVYEFLSLKNAFAVTSGLLYSESENTVNLIAAHTIHSENLEYRGTQLATVAILQLLEAESTSGALSKILKGEIPFGAHPVNGVRSTPHGMLDEVATHFRVAGTGASRFASLSEFQAIVDFLRDSPFATMGATTQGISIEVPFGANDTALIRLYTDVSHPSFGQGLAIRSVFRLNDPGQDGVALASRFQRDNLRTVNGGGLFGGWGIAPDISFDHFAWSRFIPNAMFDDGVILDAAVGEIKRCGWVDEVMHPGLPRRSAWDIMLARERLRASAREKGIES